MEALEESLSSVLRNSERYRKKAHALSTTLKNFGDSELPETKQVLLKVADNLAELQRTRQVAQARIQTNSLEPLKVYKLMCKKMKADLKSRDSALQKELRTQRKLDQLAIKEPGNIPRISQQQLSLASSVQDVVNSTNSLNVNMATFEARKNIDLKQSLGEYLYTEIAYHARALELLTQSHKTLLEADFGKDTSDVCNLLDLQRIPVSEGTPIPFQAQLAEAQAQLSPVPSTNTTATSLASPLNQSNYVLQSTGAV